MALIGHSHVAATPSRSVLALGLAQEYTGSRSIVRKEWLQWPTRTTSNLRNNRSLL
jgi:hypothetical protein